jgi:hypothetical protein
MVMNAMESAAKDLRTALKEESKRGTERSKKLLEATARYCASRLQEVQGRLLVAARDANAPASVSYHMQGVAMLMDEAFAARIAEFGDPDVSVVSKVLRGAFQDEFKNFLVGADSIASGREALRIGLEDEDPRLKQAITASELMQKLAERIMELVKLSKDMKNGKKDGGEDADDPRNVSSDKEALQRIIEFIASVVACVGDDRITLINTELFRMVDGQVVLAARDPADPKDSVVVDPENQMERARQFSIADATLKSAAEGAKGLWRAFAVIAIMRLHGATKQALEYLASVGRYAAKHGRVENMVVKDHVLFDKDKRRTSHEEIFQRALSNESSRVILGQFVGIQVRIETRQRLSRKTETRIVDDLRRLALIERGYARSAIEWYLSPGTWKDAERPAVARRAPAVDAGGGDGGGGEDEKKGV